MTPRTALRLKSVLAAAALMLAAVIGLDRIFPPPLEKAGDLSSMVYDQNGKPLRAFAASEGRWRFSAGLTEVDPVFLEALLEVEDQRFFSHGGVDWIGMVRAVFTSARVGEVVSGGSTITMQTARLLEPRPRTIPSKLIEMIRAHQIEARLSKREILELYLTLAPYGGNLEGVRAASHAYFGRAPDRLTDDQIALLIALPQSPEVRRPDLRPEHAKAGRALIADKLERLGYFTAERAEEAKNAAIPKVRRDFPMRAWHASAKARADAGGADVRSTIDSALQSELERLIAKRAAAAGDETQFSALVIHIPTRAVRAHIGSAARDKDGGWLDLTAQARSPGSTLKPFIYAMAFDDGAASPTTKIMDLPKRFAAYQPENFDRSFRGDVTVSEALQHSLNVPAVLALDRVGPQRFAATLALAGAPPRLNDGAGEGAGLALALGGAGLTARDLGLLYAALGDGGVAKPLVWRADQESEATARKGRRLMSPDSAEKVRRILAASPAPEGRVPGRLTEIAPDVAFKTGTSYGFRDAWAAAVAGDLAIIVWAGRADGAPRTGETGRSAALPVLFEIADRAAHILNDRGQSAPRIAARTPAQAKGALADFSRDDAPPEILFPPQGAELWAGPVGGKPGRAFVFSGRADGALRWYVDGAPCETDEAGAPVWRPERSGFYRVTAVNNQGVSASVRVRVIGAPPA